MRTEHDDVAPRRRRRQLILQIEVSAPTKIEMERFKRFIPERLTQFSERVSPRSGFGLTVAACQLLQLRDQTITVIGHASVKLFDRDEHRPDQSQAVVAGGHWIFIASKRRRRSWPSERSQMSARSSGVHGVARVAVRSGAWCE